MRQFLLTMLLVLSTQPASAAYWDGILAPSRATDWIDVGAGPIPARPTICQTMNPGATSAQINLALQDCPADQAVLLSAGTYTLGTPGIIINRSNVTLRGAGPDQTKLAFSGNGSCNGLGAAVCIMTNSQWYVGGTVNTANWTAGYAKGTAQLTFDAVPGLAVGMLLILDQLDDTVDDGFIYNCDTIGTCTLQGADIGRAGRRQHQTVTVTAISGTLVTIDPPLINPNWRSDRSPGAWWGSGQPLRGVGIEDLSLDYSAIPLVGHQYAMQWHSSSQSWVKNIRSINADNAHIQFYQSSRITVRDSYFYGNRGACSQAYGVEPWIADTLLIENNIFEHIAVPMMLSGSVGSVLAYNYAFDNHYNCGDPGWLQASSYHHEQGSNYNLWEGNHGPGLTADNIHGPSVLTTAFRNRWDGKDPLNVDPKDQQTVPVNLYNLNRLFNFVGNVLGTAGYHTAYQVATTTSGAETGTQCQVTIYRLGWGGHCGNAQTPGDPGLPATLLRWGNYDTASGTVRFVTGEVPSGAAQFANPVPASQALPPSFYLTAKPAWFGTVPWPPIGPDVTGGDIANVAGHAHKIPAQRCYETLALDGANPYKVFTPTDCYGVLASVPIVTITAPTSQSTFATPTSPLTTLAGTASDDVGVLSITWASDQGGSGTATCGTCGASATSVPWSVPSVALQPGANVLTVTVHDATATGGTDALTVTLTPQTASAATQFMNANLVIAGFVNACHDSGTTNAYACTPDGRLTGYVPLTCYAFRAASGNTGAATLNLSTIGPIPIQKFQGGALVPLQAGDIPSGKIVHVCYDGTVMQCHNCSP